jgi:hypothetical protein
MPAALGRVVLFPAERAVQFTRWLRAERARLRAEVAEEIAQAIDGEADTWGEALAIAREHAKEPEPTEEALAAARLRARAIVKESTDG